MVHCLLVLMLAASQIYQMSPSDVDAYLADLHARQPEFGVRVAEVAKRSLGTPYVGDPLGEGTSGNVDTDPLIDLTHVDCVTFVEQTIALAAANSYQTAFDLLQMIRYKNGERVFDKRNHFMIADWIANNRFCRDVSANLKVPTATVTRSMGRKHFYETKKLPELAQAVTDETLTLTYVPAAQAPEAERALPSPALILLIGKVDWLFTLHCGLYIRDENGKGALYNASSTESKVVACDFLASFKTSSRYLGFTAYEIRNPTEKR